MPQKLAEGSRSPRCFGLALAFTGRSYRELSTQLSIKAGDWAKEPAGGYEVRVTVTSTREVAGLESHSR
jgi:hypothetical protein